jgi:hypothetical protein
MKIGSVWQSADRTTFIIKNIEIINEQTWIFYVNSKTQQKYSCLKDAFTSRFQEQLNNG